MPLDTSNHLRAQFTSDKVKRLRVKIEKVMKDLPEEMRELVLLNNKLLIYRNNHGIYFTSVIFLKNIFPM